MLPPSGEPSSRTKLLSSKLISLLSIVGTSGPDVQIHINSPGITCEHLDEPHPRYLESVDAICIQRHFVPLFEGLLH